MEEKGLLTNDDDQNTDYLIENENTSMKCGVAWDFFDKAVDLDVTIVALDAYSLDMDAAYYNQTSILNNSIIHSGDNKTGIGEGDDEQITINLKELPSHCYSMWFIVNAYHGGTFKDVETAKFTLYDQNNQQLHSYQITMAGHNSTALLLGALYRDVNEVDWRYKQIEKPGDGLNFVESKYLMENALSTIYNADILSERPRDRTKTYQLKKSDNYIISPSISKVTVGLGWDPARGSGNIDVDGSVVIFSKDSSGALRETDIIFYGNLSDKFGGNCVRHHGDNLTGNGEGDDEQIDIFLHAIDNDSNAIDVLCVVINIYGGASSFNSIKNCFARLVDEKGNELCRYALSGQYKTKGMIMCSIEKKKNGCWALKAFGVGCKGKQASESATECKNVCSGETVITSPNVHNEDTVDDTCTCNIL